MSNLLSACLQFIFVREYNACRSKICLHLGVVNLSEPPILLVGAGITGSVSPISKGDISSIIAMADAVLIKLRSKRCLFHIDEENPRIYSATRMNSYHTVVGTYT